LIFKQLIFTFWLLLLISYIVHLKIYIIFNVTPRNLKGIVWSFYKLMFFELKGIVY
jgi:hypothetical protein